MHENNQTESNSNKYPPAQSLSVQHMQMQMYVFFALKNYTVLILESLFQVLLALYMHFVLHLYYLLSPVFPSLLNGFFYKTWLLLNKLQLNQSRRLTNLLSSTNSILHILLPSQDRLSS